MINNPGVIPTLLIGGRVYTDLTNLIQLIAYAGTTPGANSSFRKFNGSSGYAVTAGKTLTISAIAVNAVNAAQGNFSLSQTDNDVGMATATALTNPVYWGGASANIFSYLGTAGTNTSVNLNFQVAATKFLTCIVAGATTWAQFFAYGYEA